MSASTVFPGTRASIGLQPSRGLIRPDPRNPLTQHLMFALDFQEQRYVTAGTDGQQHRGVNLYQQGGAVYSSGFYGANQTVAGGEMGHSAAVASSLATYDFGPKVFVTNEATMIAVCMVNNYDTPTQTVTFQNIIGIREAGSNNAFLLFSGGASGTGNTLRANSYNIAGTGSANSNTTGKSVDNKIGYAGAARWAIVGARARYLNAASNDGEVQAFTSFQTQTNWGAWAALALAASTPRLIQADSVGFYNAPYQIAAAYFWNRPLADDMIYRVFAHPFFLGMASSGAS